MYAQSFCLLMLAGHVLVPAAAAQSSCTPGHALSFDGADDRILVPYDAAFPTEVFTAAAWIRTPGAPGRHCILARGEDAVTGNGAWNLYLDTDGTFTLRIEDISDADFSYPSGVFVADDVWHHVAAKRDGVGTVTLYVDGLIAAVHLGAGAPSSANQQSLSIGCTHGTFGPPSPMNPVNPLWFFSGWIDDPTVWSVALTDAQLAAVHAFGVDLADTGLVAAWRFDEALGQFASDTTGHGHNGTLGASPGVDAADPAWVTEAGVFSNHCVALPNSTGGTASIGVSGSMSLAANAFTLTVQGAPPNQFAVMFYGPDTAQTPLGDGHLCLGTGAIGLFRLLPVLVTDGSGAIVRPTDFGLAPMAAGAGEILAGSTWSFQAWHRDLTAGGGAGSNLTDAVRVTFCP